MRSPGFLDRVDKELRRLRWNAQSRKLLRNRLLRLLARRRFRVVAKLGNCSPIDIRPCRRRIVVDGDQISRVVPRDLLRTVDPFQGRRDRIRSPHSRSARLGFHHAMYLEGHFGTAVVRGNVAASHVFAAGTARDDEKEDD